jgi:hypothetical protein
MEDREDIQEVTPSTSLDEQVKVDSLFKLTTDEMNPWRISFLDTLKKCYKFKELDQWEDVDKSALAEYGVPPLAVDRVNRGLETIEGIRDNSSSKKKIVKSELGDERVAELLDKVCDYVEYTQDFEEPRQESFRALVDVGIGLRKVGFDADKRLPWAESVEPESFGFSPCKSKNLTDISWCWQKSVMGWEDAVGLWPHKAGEIKGLKTMVESEWQKLHGKSASVVTKSTEDYGSEGFESSGNAESVLVTEFWKKKVIPYKKVGYVVPMAQMLPDGSQIEIPTPAVKKAPHDYEIQEGEQELTFGADVIWEQTIVVGPKQGGIIVHEGQDDDHPYIAEIAERKKNGAPRGYIEKVIPHQVRINLSWGQKVAFNNKSIKTPIAVKNVADIDKILHQSKIGAVLSLTGSEEIVSVNTVPQVNLQAIEEGEAARRDMDFAASATEGVLRGQTDAGSSGIKTSMLQSAAVTPLNRWVKAENRSEYFFWKKVLKHIIKLSPEEMMRIVGMETFAALVGPKVDPMSGQVLAPALEMPLNLDIVHFDVRVQDQATSDFNKQTSFNAVEQLVAGGVPMDAEFRIKNAPIKNTDEALVSYQKARNDILMALMQENQMLKEELNVAQKEASKSANKVSNGKVAPQAGKRSMPGGQNGVLGMDKPQ